MTTHFWRDPNARTIIHCQRQKADLVWSDQTDYLSRLPLTSVQIAQQSKAAVREFVTVFFLQTLAIGWIDGGEVAAVHCRPSLRFGQNQRHQLWTRTFSPSTSVLQNIILYRTEIHYFTFYSPLGGSVIQLLTHSEDVFHHHLTASDSCQNQVSCFTVEQLASCLPDVHLSVQTPERNPTSTRSFSFSIQY